MIKTFNYTGKYDNTTYEVEFKGEQITSDAEIISLIVRYNWVVQYWERQAYITPVERRNREIKKELLEKHNVYRFDIV